MATKITNELDSWTDYVSKAYIKASDIKSEQDGYVIIEIEKFVDDKSGIGLKTTLERKGEEFLWSINKTNAQKLKELGVSNPKALIGKVIYFKKVMTRDPNKNQEVEGLRIWKVE